MRVRNEALACPSRVAKVLTEKAQETGGLVTPALFHRALKELGVEFRNWEDEERLFLSLDTDGSGAIELHELKAAISFIIDPGEDSALEKLMMMDGSGLGDAVQTLRSSLASQAARVIDLFKRWDVNGGMHVPAPKLLHRYVHRYDRHMVPKHMLRSQMPRPRATACPIPALLPPSHPPVIHRTYKPLRYLGACTADGSITKDEFRVALQQDLGMASVTDAEIDSLFTSFDVDGSGTITFREVSRMLRKNNGEAFSFQKAKGKGPVRPIETDELRRQVRS